ncbi:Uncharacterised protein [Mycobacteroides abscessus subsp. abscessus]|uniref:hypothetical protein n=1 Tax=Mycobacteroides abscessus TaxID=36809 RepID=UPI0009A55E48|nr:hypothetical protein [Mycobacteroides abscessus]SLI00796.1 Uncharacterised protein [Mycobacteroides abscessus subsp. abscessus]
MTNLKERTQRDLYLVAKHRDELHKTLRELPAGTARVDIKTARAAVHEADAHLSRAIGRAILAGWPPNQLRGVGLPVHSALARMARGFAVSLLAGVVVLAIGALILPSWWVALILAVIAYAANMWLEYRADRPVFTRYTELIMRLRQQQPW